MRDGERKVPVGLTVKLDIPNLKEELIWRYEPYEPDPEAIRREAEIQRRENLWTAIIFLSVLFLVGLVIWFVGVNW